jgi:hypothetical protein
MIMSSCCNCYIGNIDNTGGKSIIYDDCHLPRTLSMYIPNVGARWGDMHLYTIATANTILKHYQPHSSLGILGLQFADDFLQHIPSNENWVLEEKELEEYLVNKELPKWFLKWIPIFNATPQSTPSNKDEKKEERIVTDLYTLGTDEEGKFIYCRTCKNQSYHPEDIKHIYCGNCRMFLKEK